MGLKPTTTTYRFLIKPKTPDDPRSKGYLADARAMGMDRLEEIQCSDLYFVRGALDGEQAQRLADQLLHDPVTQTVDISVLDPQGSDPDAPARNVPPAALIEVAYRPGVTDPVAEQILRAAKVMGITGVNAASTGLRFVVKGRDLSEDVLHQLARRLFANEVIQRYALGEIAPTFTEAAAASDVVETIRLRGLSPEELLELSAERRAALNLEEMLAIQAYCEREGRDLTDVEFEMLAQTWSEHCVHKTFKSRVTVEQDDSSCRRFPAEYRHLFDQTIRAATRAVDAPWVRSAFRDDAGIVDFDGELVLSFKVETHNHPSAIEPFGGANTGIGGVIRDVVGVSAKPIASTDVLCFGPQDLRLEDLPDGVLHPRRVASGVVAGIEDYGNKMGIPTVNGAVWYDPGYTANPLVFCGCVGLAPRDSHPRAVQPGDRVVVLGGRTGRDGLRGATFSSMTMDAQTGEVSGASVQIGAPIVEKGLVDVLMEARDRRLYHAITDCGAGGLSSAVGEMAAELGCEVQLRDAPLKYPGLAPWEIWLSEAQERMVIAVPAENLPVLAEICNRYEVEWTDIGAFTSSMRTRVYYGERLILDLDNEFLHRGLPQRHYRAKIRPPRCAPGQRSAEPVAVKDGRQVLLRLLAHPNIASKERIVRVYDHEVQGGTVIKPLCGLHHDGPSDGCVIKPLAGRGTQAFVLSAGLNPEYGKHDPYEMAMLAVDEAVRNAVACGADPDRISLLDNFCWGDPTRPETMGDLVQAAQACYDAALRYRTPFISGKDSFNNEYVGSDGQRRAIPPTLLISALGWMPDWRQALTMDLKTAGSALYLVGEFEPVFGGSHFNLVYPQASVVEGVPRCSPNNPQVYRTLYRAITRGLVSACHDLSEGGLAVAAAEMAIAGRLGIRLDLGDKPEAPRALFGETGGCLLVEVPSVKRPAFEELMGAVPCRKIGMVTDEPALQVIFREKIYLQAALSELLLAWKDGVIEGGAA